MQAPAVNPEHLASLLAELVRGNGAADEAVRQLEPLPGFAAALCVR